MNWLDWLFILIIVFSGWQGLSKGLIHSMSRLLGIIVGLGVAFTGYRALANYLDFHLGWGSSVSAFLLERIPLTLLEQFNQKISLLDLLLTMFNSQQQNQTLQFDIPGNIQTMVNHLAISLIEVIAFIALLWGSSIIIKIVLRIISSIVPKTFFRPLDLVGGLIMGLLRGILITLILVMLARPFITVGDTDISGSRGLINQGIAGSKLYPYTTEFLKTLNLSVPIGPLQNSYFRQI